MKLNQEQAERLFKEHLEKLDVNATRLEPWMASALQLIERYFGKESTEYDNFAEMMDNYYEEKKLKNTSEQFMRKVSLRKVEQQFSDIFKLVTELKNKGELGSPCRTPRFTVIESVVCSKQEIVILN